MALFLFLSLSLVSVSLSLSLSLSTMKHKSRRIKRKQFISHLYTCHVMRCSRAVKTVVCEQQKIHNLTRNYASRVLVKLGQQVLLRKSESDVPELTVLLLLYIIRLLGAVNDNNLERERAGGNREGEKERRKRQGRRERNERLQG
jgi:hypothetical protein